MKQERENVEKPEAALRDWLSNAERVVVIGIGNPLRKDDFVGGQIVGAMLGKTSKSVLPIVSETVPEDFIKPITEFGPTHILLIDTALLDREPGSFALIDPERLAKSPALFTHALPLGLFCGYLRETTRAKIILLAIQPKETDFGEGLTPELKKTAKYLTSFLLKVLAKLMHPK